MTRPYDRELSADELAVLPDDRIDYADIPELDDEFWKSAEVVEPEGTEKVTLHIRKAALAAFRSTGKGYQTRMGAVLESYARHLRSTKDERRS